MSSGDDLDSSFERNIELLKQIPRLSPGGKVGHMMFDVGPLVDRDGWSVEELNRFADGWPEAGHHALGKLMAIAAGIRRRYEIDNVDELVAWTRAMCKLGMRSARPRLFVAKQMAKHKMGANPVFIVGLYIKMAGSRPAGLQALQSGMTAEEAEKLGPE